MLRIISFFWMVAMAAAFAPATPAAARWGLASTATFTRSTPLAMFSGDEPKGLEEVEDPKQQTTMEAVSVVEEGETSDATPDAPKSVYRNLARGGEVTSVPWVDEAMRANTNPFEMSWWAYIIFGLPVTLLLNDFLHFLPKDGPLAFLNNL
jgi:hypothetical protein